jgi:hypothetical protein
MASEGVRDVLPTRLSSMNHGRQRSDHAKPTTTRDVEPNSWALARHGLAESVMSMMAWIKRERPATRQPAIKGAINSGEDGGR